MVNASGGDTGVEGGRQAAGDSWQAVLDAAIPAIVALKVSAVRSFQDDTPGAHGGTGFVVDAARGLLLTNRHVCTCGPARASATFVGSPSMEELPVDIAYVDPGHDFALLRFDPSRLCRTPRAEITLDPQACLVGEEIRVVGNDSLEKLQVLSGTIARVDRNAPDIEGDYQDENTFYALAGSGTRGGSSGSPVLNRQGRAIALNAAARGGTMHAFFLPLHRISRALAAVQAGERVQRGTLCTAFAYASFPECIRLGVPAEFVQDVVLGAKPPEGGTFSPSCPPAGMLKVQRCIPESAAAAVLESGDVLLELDGRPCVDYVLLDLALDEAVGQVLKLVLSRGDRRVEVELAVQDLHGLIPHAFLELSLGVFHEVPYHTAQKHNIPLKGVYVAQAGFVFGEALRSDAVILEVNGGPCANLRDFEEALQQIPDKEYFAVTWIAPKVAHDRRTREGLAKMQRQWGANRLWTLDFASRAWKPRRIADAPATAEAVAADATPEPPTKKRRIAKRDAAAVALEECLCTVVFRTVQNFDTDLVVDAQDEEADIISNRGVGIIIDANAGLVLTDRGTVPQPLGDIEVTLGRQCRGASVFFVHPVHSLVVLQLDEEGGSRALGKAATFEDHAFDAGEEVHFCSREDDGKLATSQVKVQAVRLAEFPRHPQYRWRERNLEAVGLASMPVQTSGVLTSEQGSIYAVYSVATGDAEGQSIRFGYGIPFHAVKPLLEQLGCTARTAKAPAAPVLPAAEEVPAAALAATCTGSTEEVASPPAPVPLAAAAFDSERAADLRATLLGVPSLEIELRPMDLQKLRRLPARMRPPNEWLHKLEVSSDSVLQVVGVTHGGPCSGKGRVAEGDLLVAVAGETVATAQGVETALWEAWLKAREQQQQGAAALDSFRTSLTLLARGKARELQVDVPLLRSDGAHRLLCWQGLVLREMPRAARECGKVLSAVYISRTMLGSPAESDGVEGDFLLAVDGVATPTLDAVTALAKKRAAATEAPTPVRCGERRHLRVETAVVGGRRSVAMVEPDPLFWPTLEMSQGEHGSWSCAEFVW